MKAILKFSIPKEEAEFRHATQAPAYYGALCDIYEMLRRESKHNNNPVMCELASELIDEFYDILNHRDIEI